MSIRLSYDRSQPYDRPPLRARVAHGTRADANRRLAIRATVVGAAALAVGWYLGPEDGLIPVLVLAGLGGYLGIRRVREVWVRRTVGRWIRRSVGETPVSLGMWRVAGSGYWLRPAADGSVRAAGTCGERRRASVGRVGTRAVADDASGGACGVACGGRLGGRGAAIGVRSAARRPTRGRDDHVRRADDVRRPAGRARQPSRRPHRCLRARRPGIPRAPMGPSSRGRRHANRRRDR